MSRLVSQKYERSVSRTRSLWKHGFVRLFSFKPDIRIHAFPSDLSITLGLYRSFTLGSSFAITWRLPRTSGECQWVIGELIGKKDVLLPQASHKRGNT